MKVTLGMGAAEAADVIRRESVPVKLQVEMQDVPAAASSFLGTATVSFLSSSNRAGEMVRKSTPAKALISPVCEGKLGFHM